MGLGKIVSLRWGDVGGEAGGRLRCRILWKNRHIPHENASDFRVFARRDRGPPVARDSFPHPFQAVRAVCEAEELPGFGNAKSGEPAVKAAADDAVVRAVRLEEERLADS